VPEGDPAAEDELGAVAEADGDGELLGLLLDGVGVGEDEDGVGVGGWVECVGVGDGVPDEGSAWHFVSVFALALADALGLGEAAASCIVAAWAVPGPPVSAPRARKPPDSTLSTAARTCARRMKLALSTLLIDVTVYSLWYSEPTR
jgi:hypothetical protein